MTDEDFNDALTCVSTAWHRELRFARTWADSFAVEWDDREEPTGFIVFTKAGAEFSFIIGDECWDADDPRGEMIESLLVAIIRMQPVVDAALLLMEPIQMDHSLASARRSMLAAAVATYRKEAT